MSQPGSFHADDVVDGSTARPDELDRDRFARHVGILIKGVAQGSESSVLAIVGPWGSGKSSLLAMIAKEFQRQPQPQEWSICEFNPWLYSDIDSMQVGFFASLRESMPSNSRWNETGEKIAKFGTAIAPVLKLTTLVGINTAPAIDAGLDRLRAKSANQRRSQVEESLRKHEHRVLIGMDDLDRLAPDELLLVMKLVRLVGRLPNIYYLLSYDEKTVLDVLSRSSLVPDEERARDYLEKIVQVRLDIPPLREPQRLRLLNEGLEKVLKINLISLQDDEIGRLSRVYADYLAEQLTTPRIIRRFLGQVAAFLPTVVNEVDFVDFFVLTWIRTNEPQVYQLLQSKKNELTGQSGMSLYLFEGHTTPDQKREKWHSLLRQCGTDDDKASGLLTMLSSLFPPVGGVDFAGIRYMPGDRRIGNVDYFDRYFSFGVPDEDVSDHAVISALKALATDMQSSDLLLVRRRLLLDTRRVAGKIRSHLNDPGFPVKQVFLLLVEAFPALLPRIGLFDNHQDVIALLIADVLERSPIDVSNQLAQHLSADNERSLAARIGLVYLERLKQEGQAELERGRYRSVIGVIGGILDSWVKNRTDGVSLSVFSREQRSKILELLAIQPDLLRDFADRQISTGTWELVDFITLLVGDLIPIGAGSDYGMLGQLNLADVESTVGLDRAIKVIRELIAFEPDAPIDLYDLSWNNRREHAISFLRTEMRRRDSAVVA